MTHTAKILVQRHDQKNTVKYEYNGDKADKGNHLSQEGIENCIERGKTLFGNNEPFTSIYRESSDFDRCIESDKHTLSGAGYDEEKLKSMGNLTILVKNRDLGFTPADWDTSPGMDYDNMPEQEYIKGMILRYLLPRQDDPGITGPKAWPVLGVGTAAAIAAVENGIRFASKYKSQGGQSLIPVTTHGTFMSGFGNYVGDRIDINPTEEQVGSKTVHTVELAQPAVSYGKGEFVLGEAKIPDNPNDINKTEITLRLKGPENTYVYETTLEELAKKQIALNTAIKTGVQRFTE